MEASESVMERPGTPVELIEEAEEASKLLLPAKSKKRYEQIYREYNEWKNLKNATSNSERTVLSFFSEMVKTTNGKSKLKPTTVWAKYSMLKATLKIYEKIDISAYASLNAFLKRQSEGHVPKKAKILTESQVQQFLGNAPDEILLDVKTVCVFSIFGAGRTHELPSIRMENIARYEDMYYVTIPKENRKNNEKNCFGITGAMLEIVRKYEKLRPSGVTCDRFFLNYQRGKCTNQPIGKNKFYKMPHRIAEYLNLPDPELYTGHSFRRSSTTIYANTRATIEAIKRHTGHKSTKVCESYIDDSVGYSRKAANAIAPSTNCTSSDSFESAAGAETSNASVAMDCEGTATAQSDGSSSVVDESTVAASETHPSVPAPPTATNDDCILSQVTTTSQNFMAQLGKQFAFYKCDGMTINFKTK